MASTVFGPVPSRRLGRSLGVDLVPLKTCTFDCIYCQLGRTTSKTVERREWVPLQDVLADVRQGLASEPDYVTLSGSGEPTLYAPLGELVAGIKRLTRTPVAVLTNGSLLWQPAVAEAVAQADVVIPSLDAGDEAMLERVNRPHVSLAFDRIVEGLVALREQYRGPYWLEVFLLDGITATEEEAGKIAEVARRIGPDRVQLNTVTRPAAEPEARPAPEERMRRLAALFGDRAEVIVERFVTHECREFVAHREDVLAMLRRRPCTVADIARGLGIHRHEVVKYVHDLAGRGLVEAEILDERVYYRAK